MDVAKQVNSEEERAIGLALVFLKRKVENSELSNSIESRYVDPRKRVRASGQKWAPWYSEWGTHQTEWRAGLPATSWYLDSVLAGYGNKYMDNFDSSPTLIYNETMSFNPVPENLKKGKILDPYLRQLPARCGPRFRGGCSIKQVGHHGWPTKKILNSRLSKTCLNHIFYIFFSIRTNILIVYCALQINGTVSLWSALYGFSVAAFVKYVSHNHYKTNVKTEFQKYINS